MPALMATIKSTIPMMMRSIIKVSIVRFENWFRVMYCTTLEAMMLRCNALILQLVDFVLCKSKAKHGLWFGFQVGIFVM